VTQGIAANLVKDADQSTWLLAAHAAQQPALSDVVVHHHQVDDMVVVMDEALRAEACGVATQLRGRGRRVDLVLQAKKMKWVFKQAERCVRALLSTSTTASSLLQAAVSGPLQPRYFSASTVEARACRSNTIVSVVWCGSSQQACDCMQMQCGATSFDGARRVGTWRCTCQAPG
jgi:hypothetical protein